MKKLIFLSTIFIIGFYSCKKEKPPQMDYAISGQKDTTFNYKKLSEKISVKFNSGEKSNVNLSVSGLPKGLDARFTNASGTPDFETSIELNHNDYIIAGTYPIKINGSAADGNIKSADFNVTVQGSCGDYISGSYETEVTYTSSGELFSNSLYTVSIKSDNPNRLYFFDGKNTDPDFYADVDCLASTIVIPSQNKYGSSLSFSGSGKMINKTRQIDFTIKYEGFTELKFALTRQ